MYSSNYISSLKRSVSPSGIIIIFVVIDAAEVRCVRSRRHFRARLSRLLLRRAELDLQRGKTRMQRALNGREVILCALNREGEISVTDFRSALVDARIGNTLRSCRTLTRAFPALLVGEEAPKLELPSILKGPTTLDPPRSILLPRINGAG